MAVFCDYYIGDSAVLAVGQPLDTALHFQFAESAGSVSYTHLDVYKRQNVASDPLYTASYCGVNGGMVMVVADDPGLYSSQNEQDTRMVARAAQVPVLELSLIHI